MEKESEGFLRNTLSYIPNFSEPLDSTNYFSPQRKYQIPKNNTRMISSYAQGPRSTSFQQEKPSYNNSNLFIIEERGLPNQNYGIKRNDMFQRVHPSSNYMPESKFSRGRGINLTIGHHKFEKVNKLC